MIRHSKQINPLILIALVFVSYTENRLEIAHARADLPPLARQVQEDRADDPKAWRRQGIKKMNQGRFEEALSSFNQAILLNGKDPEAWNLKGEALRKLDRDKEALAAFEKALEIRPKLTRAMHNKGAVLQGLGRMKEALEVYEVLIRRNASDAKAWQGKAEGLFFMGRTFEALDAVSQALEINPMLQDAARLKEKLESKIQDQRFNL